MSDLPSISDVAAKFAPEPTSAAAAAVDPSSGKGGTTTDPSLDPTATLPPAAEPVEGAPEATAEEVKEPVKPDPLSTKFSALARKEREIRAKEAAFNEKMASYEAKLKELETRSAAPTDKPKSPMDALKQFGFSYADATNQIVGGWKEPEVDPLDERLRPVQEKLSAVERLEAKLAQMEQEAAQAKQNAAYEQAMSAISSTIEEGGEKYEYIQKLGDQAVDLVRDTIVEYYKEHKKMLDYSEACDIVEEWYENNVVSQLLSTKKVQSRLPKPTTQAKPSTPAKEAKAPSQTLTNSLQQSGSEAKIDLDKLSKDEALALLAKKLQFIEN
jgi:hypothetical protein